jgi:hypothetical protein
MIDRIGATRLAFFTSQGTKASRGGSQRQTTAIGVALSSWRDGKVDDASSYPFPVTQARVQEMTGHHGGHLTSRPLVVVGSARRSRRSRFVRDAPSSPPRIAIGGGGVVI